MASTGKARTRAQRSEWTTIAEAWSAFAQQHPELNLKSESDSRINIFLRRAKVALVAVDALRVGNGKRLLAHRERFPRVAFELMTAERGHT